MDIQITYKAPDIDSLCAAIQAVRALGVTTPVVAITPPAIAQARTIGAEPNVDAYQSELAQWCAETDPRLKVPAFFRQADDEKARGLTRDESARLRMERDGWQALAMERQLKALRESGGAVPHYAGGTVAGGATLDESEAL